MLSKRKSIYWQSQGVCTGTQFPAQGPALGTTCVPDTTMATPEGTVLAGRGRGATVAVGRALGSSCAHPVLGIQGALYWQPSPRVS